MNTMKVTGENPFQVIGKGFAIGPSKEGYTLNYSADGVNWTAYEEATEAEKTELVNSPVPGLYYKLVGNASTVTVRF